MAGGGGATIHEHDTPSWPDIYVYQISSNYLKGYKLLSAQAFYSKEDSRENTQKGNKGSYHLKM